MIELHSYAYGETAHADMDLASRIMAELQRYYAGHRWHVEANHEAGTVVLKLNYTTKLGRLSNCGVLLHIVGLGDGGSMRKIMRAGGELLERWGLPRTVYREGDGLKALENGLLLGGARWGVRGA